ncbi:LPS assembly protein LptD [bacterium]|nr:LPS assembly protein LptD [bacterium]
MIKSHFKYPLILLSISFLFSSAQAQSSPDPDSSLINTTSISQPNAISSSDSVETAVDTVATESSDLDTTIAYTAKSIEFFVKDKRTILNGDAQFTYQGMTLKAEKITVAWDEDLIIAEGVPDTLWSDSTHTVIDTIMTRGRPVFSEGGQDMSGERMTYHLKSKKGKISGGQTSFDEGYYWGASIKKETDDILYVGPGSFTTCDKAEPHFCFKSQRMMMKKDDKVVAKPVVLHFGEVPVAVLPYGVFPARKGRHSGIIIPTYGETGAQGRFIQRLGYYWVLNDYADVTTSMDYYEESGFLFHGSSRYNRRYLFSGTMNGSYINQHFGGTAKRRWELQWGHDQIITPNTRLRVDANIISDGSYYQDYSLNLNEQLTQKLYSNATLSHSWPGTKNSMSVNLSHEQNLQTEEVTQSLPRLSFRRGQSAIIPLPKKAPGDTTEIESEWYHSLYYSYSGELWQRRILDQNIASGDTSLVQDLRTAAKHSINFSSPQDIFKYFSLNPSLSYREDWFGEALDYSNNPAGEKVSGFYSRRTFSSGLSLSTKIYGLWSEPFRNVQGIRHTMTPTLSLNFTPDFSDPEWGYFQTVTTDSTSDRKDRYYGSLYGGTPKGKTLGLGFRLSNLFQMKTGKGEEEKKLDLFNLDFSTSYNIVADSLNFTPLSSSFRASPISGKSSVGPLSRLSFDVKTTHSFYKYGSNGLYDEYYFAPEEGKILRLTKFDISANSSFSLGTLRHTRESVLEKDTKDSQFGIASEELEADTMLAEQTALPKVDEGWFMGQVPWDLKLSLHYTSNRNNPNDFSETFWLNASIDASLTRYWQVSYNTRFDLIDHKVVSAGLTIYRDMHCWEGRITWNPLGVGQGFFLKINIKASQLKDVKVEKKQGQGTFMGF